MNNTKSYMSILLISVQLQETRVPVSNWISANESQTTSVHLRSSGKTLTASEARSYDTASHRAFWRFDVKTSHAVRPCQAVPESEDRRGTDHRRILMRSNVAMAQKTWHFHQFPISITFPSRHHDIISQVLYLQVTLKVSCCHVMGQAKPMAMVCSLKSWMLTRICDKKLRDEANMQCCVWLVHSPNYA